MDTQIPTGGATRADQAATQLAEAQSWWPVALCADVTQTPGAATLLGQELVLWRSESGAVAMADQCPHRGARLSLGQVHNDTLQCPYHGWRFGSNGACVAIPAVPGFTPPASHSACRYDTQEAHGLVWVRLARPGVPDAPAYQGAGDELGLPSLGHLPTRRLIYGPFDVATSAPRAVENFLDTSHFAFVHEGWLGDAAHPEVPHYDVTHTPDGRPVIEDYRAWQPRAAASAAGGDWVHYRYEVLSPYAALLSKHGQAGGPQDHYTIWACPSGPEHCRLWFAQYTTDTTSSDEALRDFQVAIFAQDQPVLESQRPRRLPISGGEAMSAADRLSVAYRRYLKASGISVGVC
jgi:phenylpropionate dioxygenase-like ring-hydroxylating dioxygenase large terminal subunit